MLCSRQWQRRRIGYELIKHIVASGSSPAPDRRRSLLVYVIRGLCDSALYRTEPWAVSTYAERLHGCLAADAGTVVAQAQSGCRNLTDRVLVSALFSLCNS